MIKLKNIVKSDKKDKKYTAIFEITKDGKTRTKITHFGFENPDDKDNDYTRHGDIERRNRYIDRARRLNIYNKTGKFPISDLISQAEKK